MKTSEHILLKRLEETVVKPRRPKEIAEICLSCRGKCKASEGLVRCPGKEK